ncbi:CheR family methyltransferase [Paracoccus endophyticus]|uniref:CheR family methyltransferase n=1 Tax=Paracoccus endophyticus TaxID=2233774 RepID=UPI0013A6A01B|nr:CheR family methyltransferase [Paracoccus endophyticus]
MSRDSATDLAAPSQVVAAITASAARPASAEALLRRLPPQEGAALVVVLQHMEAFDEAPFRQAASEGGHDPVWIADGMPVEPGRLYLTPPDRVVTIEGDHFAAQPTQQAPGLQGVIDSFLVSLARDQGDRAIGVALDGTDGDGTLGAREIKAAGGVVLAESVPEDLAHSDSAAALADAVLAVEDIPARLVSLIAQAARSPGDAAAADPDDAATAEALEAIAGLLRQKTGHDFHGYKRGTFLRRVQRRMQALLIDDLPAYLDLLRTAADEPQNLFNDLLIGVTEFFRDKKEWAVLEQEVIPHLFQGKVREPLRVWVAGCSTGEEVYSLAMLLAEHRATLEEPTAIQIFASDLDGRALAMGRAGRYPDSIAAQMTPERLARWFVREGDTYCVVKELREMCIFSHHSLIKDAPFSRLDLISCRNLLIYLDAELQEKVIPLFHFALRPGGFLFLGNSENASRHQTLFLPVEPRCRIFRRLDTPRRVVPDFPFTAVQRGQASRTAPEAPARDRSVADLTRWAEHAMERHTPAFVVIDESHTVLHFSGPMGRYLAPASGAASLNLLQLAHPMLRVELRAALGRAAEKVQTVEVGGLEIGTGGLCLRLDLIVEPRIAEPGRQAGFLVIFRDCGTSASAGGAGDAAPGQRAEHLQRLEEDLRLTRDRLQATIEELESTNEELKSSNEEYQSLNEELQSANEELETSKEELQSVNEELTTVNGELAHRVQELGRANSDLKNFLESTQIATLFLDNDLRVTNFTPAIVDVFHLVEADEGRPIAHIKARVAYEDLAQDARRVLRTLAPVEREIDDPETHARYIARLLPYRSTDNFIAGVVATFLDVTARREAEERLRRSEERYRAIVETASDYAIFTTDIAGRIETWPPGAENVFGWRADEAVGQPVDITFTPEDRAAGQPEQERQAALEDGQAPDVRWHLRKTGGRVFIDGMMRPLRGAEGQPVGFLKIGRDVTEQRSTEAALRASEARQAFLLKMSDALRPLTDAAEIQAAAARLLAGHLGAGCGFWRDIGDGPGAVVAVACGEEGHSGEARTGPPAPERLDEVFGQGWIAHALGRGEPVVVEDADQDPRPDAPAKAAWQALGLRALVAVPLIEQGREALSFGVFQDSPRPWSPAEVELVREVAERTRAAAGRARAEAALRRTEAQLTAFGEASSDLLWIRDADTLAFEYVSPAFDRVFGRPRDEALGGDTLEGWLGLIVPEDRERARDAVERLRAGERLVFEYRATRPSDGQVRLIRDAGFPIRGPDERVLWIAGVGHDATQEAASAERLTVLVAELQHRTRNLLGVVRSVMEQTLNGSTSLDDFNARIRERLGALARVNGLLSRLSEDDRIDFDELIRSELDAHGVLGGGGTGPRVRLRGPRKIRLRSSTVQTLALGLHELATNALKYGALSRPEGQLDVRWSLLAAPGAPPRLRVDWRESGVPVAAADGPGTASPARQGYGRELIEQALPYQLNAEVDYDLAPEGVRCTITLPVSTSMEEAALLPATADA